jgi:hypothetical protein
MTTNQRGEPLYTSTPIADMSSQLSSASLCFPQVADGGGYETALLFLNTSGVQESGTLVADSTSTLTAALQNQTTLQGNIQRAGLTIDSTSAWNVTGNSILTTLADTSGISGLTITNVIGNGYTVYYDATLTANASLGGLTYSLVNGGKLMPK